MFYECIFQKLLQVLQQQQQLALYYEIDNPLTKMMARVENSGLLLDAIYLKQLNVKYSNGIVDVSQRIYKDAGREFNIASSMQLGKILFEDL